MNFFKKYWIAILIIIVLVISFIIGIFEGLYETKQEPKSLSNYHEELDNDKQDNHLPRTKRELETPKPKIKITQEKYDKIKSYILSENENEVFTLRGLSQEEITAIEKARNSQKQTLKFEKEDKQNIDEEQNKCDGYNKQISELDPKKDEIEIKALNDMLSNTQKLKDSLQRDYDNSQNSYGDPLKPLNSLYEIIPSE
ncbi:hypothetical protein [Candidatus Phytoplasma fraxini]|uniref:Secreted protein n=1 Tax=Ash yellows phytoplasma TaxID=35780 RepID=A0ABZ2U862_ASHYP